jgi:hypothetical protein
MSKSIFLCYSSQASGIVSFIQPPTQELRHSSRTSGKIDSVAIFNVHSVVFVAGMHATTSTGETGLENQLVIIFK